MALVMDPQEIIAQGDDLEFEATEAYPPSEDVTLVKEVEKREKKEDSELDKIMSKVEVLRISQVTSDDVELGAMRVSCGGLSFPSENVFP